jgi:hypothetical protein
VVVEFAVRRLRDFLRRDLALLVDVNGEAIHLNMTPGSDRSRLRRAMVIDEMAELMRGHERARRYPHALEPLIDV